MILSATLFLLAVICYSIRELNSFGKLRWTYKKDEHSFWGSESWARKYKFGVGHFMAPLDNWYYRLFKVTYRERFPGSATIFVFITDGAHLMQFFFKLLFCSAFYPLTNWWFPFTLWLLWTIVWNLCDRYLTK